MKGFFRAVGRFFKNIGFGIAKCFVLTARELKKVRWPNKKVMKEATAIVLSVVLLFGLYILLDDYIVAQLLKLINY